MRVFLLVTLLIKYSRESFVLSDDQEYDGFVECRMPSGNARDGQTSELAYWRSDRICSRTWVDVHEGKWKGHIFGTLWCPLQTREGCRFRVYSTPRNPEDHAKRIRRAVDGCPHQGATS